MKSEPAMATNSPTFLCPTTEARIGDNIRWGRNVVFGANCRRVTIGYGAFVGDEVYIDVEELMIGDYFTLHHGSVLHGQKCAIGHNCWVGPYCILDSLGGYLTMGNNVGVGAHSQLWSHMKFGDRLAGCRWYRMGSLDIGDDVWFVGHCIVTPIKASARSMLMVGGLAVKDMKENHVYAGSPAKDMTEQFGPQFQEVSPAQQEARFSNYLDEYRRQGHETDFVRLVPSREELAADCAHTSFCLATREYSPRYTADEVRFMRFLLYDKAKFVPVGQRVMFPILETR
jgi:acetyltransferase-like isoleucine patch superfamily enzyme